MQAQGGTGFQPVRATPIHAATRNGPTTVALAFGIRLMSSRRAWRSTMLAGESNPSFEMRASSSSDAQRASVTSMVGASGAKADAFVTIMTRNLLARVDGSRDYEQIAVSSASPLFRTPRSRRCSLLPFAVDAPIGQRFQDRAALR